MNKFLCIVSVLLFPLLAKASEQELLRCTRGGTFIGSPMYTLSTVENPGVPIRYFLKMVPMNPNVRPTYLEIPRPIHYGDTWIATKDVGRSGYAHLYSRGSVTLLDVNLFLARERGMNTNGPLGNYSCATPR
ncbi:MAG: hypothetical protein ACXVB9_17805 [Bdellovibrionota bacterium]